MKILTTVLMIVTFATISLGQGKPEISPIKGVKTIPDGYGFGPRVHPTLKVRKMHEGVDFKVPLGTPVRATAGGTVTEARSIEGYGLVVRIRHKNGYETFYAHLSKLAVKKGKTVREGDTIAFSGNSGLSAGPHLHYEVLKDGKRVDPKGYFASK
jgi:murein DD-endopeptidase MepM/ murein hydrolase activator NlpD